MNKMTNRQYADYIDRKAPKFPLLKNLILAFVIGGAICTVGQGLSAAYEAAGLLKETVMAAVPVTLIFLGALLTGLKVYDSVAKHAGAGTAVPITGFSNAIVSPAMEFKAEGYVLGMGAKMFAVAGPVLVFGISASVIYGIVLLLIR